MFNKDALFGKKDEIGPDSRQVNVTPGLGGTPPRPVSAPTSPVQPSPAPAELPRNAAPTTELAGSKLIVGPDIKLKGVEITDCDTLVVEGRVEASMDSRVVQIAENGVFTGTATMDVAEIWGRFDGNLTVRKQLVIYATGRVSGQIRYGKISVAEGGELSGEVSTLSSGHAPRKGKDNTYEPVPSGKQSGKTGTTV